MKPVIKKAHIQWFHLNATSQMGTSIKRWSTLISGWLELEKTVNSMDFWGDIMFWNCDGCTTVHVLKNYWIVNRNKNPIPGEVHRNLY